MMQIIILRQSGDWGTGSRNKGDSMQKKTENLKEYFIVRLLFVMLFILVSESLVNLLITQEVFPVLYNVFGVELVTENPGIFGRAGTLIQILLYIAGGSLGSFLTGMLPAPVSLFWQRILPVLETENWFPAVEKPDGWLLLIVIVGLVLYILPYVIGIGIYSFIVVRKVEEIRSFDREQREQYIKRRNLLLSDVAHDLKTPITTISGYAQALNEGIVESPEKQREYLKVIYQKSLQMNQLITVLFDYVKLDSEGFELKTESVDLAEFLREAGAEMYSDIENGGMELLVELPEKECSVMADKAQLMRAVLNLLANAVKHNPKGTKIRISLEELSGYEEGWKVQIADTGSRIEKELEEHLFEPFVMGDESRNSRAGSGLGLSIAAKIVEMHGGTLSLDQNLKTPYTKAFCIKMRKSREVEADGYDYDEK